MSLPILLDTCTAMWIVEGLPVKQGAMEEMEAASEMFVSPITGWEIGMLASRGRFRSRYTPQKWLAALLAIPGIGLAEMPPGLLLESNFLPGDPPRDPWDRVIIATAREFGFTLITRDRALLAYAREGHLSALEC